jgi:ABC-2 type transport system ATP-binding protein
LSFVTTPTTTPAIDVRDLVVRRGKREVLHGLNCTIPAGSVTGLLGPSGSGKTTLMRAVVGVQKVARGTVSVLGQPAGTASLRSKVGYLTQAPSIYGDLTVRENARYFASLYKGVSAADADAAVESVGLADHASQLVRDLSGGQWARASLACTLVSRPQVLILDEPTVGQDPVLRDELWRQFRAAAADGVTVLVSSHVMDEAGRCDRLLLIRDGHLVADQSPGAITAATGTSDLEAAFLHLIRSGQTVMSS